MKNKFAVRILPRDVILDTQGRAVGQTLQQMGFGDVSVRVGKYIEIEIEGTEGESKAAAEKIAGDLLANPLIETFRVDKITGDDSSKKVNS